MLLPDVNILIYAHRTETDRHKKCADWLTRLASSDSQFAISELVLHGFVRIVTNKKIFKPATSPKLALEFCSSLLNCGNVTAIRPGERHWQIFTRLLNKHNLTGKLVADAYHAALAIEYGCQWVTSDTDFALFQEDLDWKLI